MYAIIFDRQLVTADGVVYASRDLKADIILDMATLTGAQVCGRFKVVVMNRRKDYLMKFPHIPLSKKNSNLIKRLSSTSLSFSFLFKKYSDICLCIQTLRTDVLGIVVHRCQNDAPGLNCLVNPSQFFRFWKLT